MRRLPRLALLGLFLATVAAVSPTAAEAGNVPNPDPSLIDVWQPCEPGVGVTVIVDRNGRLGDGRIDVRCAPGAQPSGWAALEDAGFTVQGTTQYPTAFVCRIDGEPTFAEQTCEQTPGASAFWGYFVGRPGGRWASSGVGAADPRSAAPVDSVQGWGFGGIRIEPMNGSGPSAFTLPPAQESSTVPAARAREWLLRTVLRTVGLAEQAGSGVEPDPEALLGEGRALANSGVGAARLAPLLANLGRQTRSGPYQYSSLQKWANLAGWLDGLDPEGPEFPLWGDPARYALAVEAIAAMGGDPADFAGADMRGELEALIDEASGRILRRTAGGVNESSDPVELAQAVEALAVSGPLPAKGTASLDLLLSLQDPVSGAFSDRAAGQSTVIAALVAAREDGVTGLDAAIEKAGGYLESLQEADGSLRAEAGAPNPAGEVFAPTAAGALGLGLAGRSAAAEAAGKLVSRYQVTPEYAGSADPVTGDPAPAEPLVGAFARTEGELKEVLALGLGAGVQPRGPYDAQQVTTAEALEALEAAGPYGPLYVEFDEPSVFFEGQTVGTESAPLAVTLSNLDERPVSLGHLARGGDAGEFTVDASACEGHTLAPGGSCEVSVTFAPQTTGFHQASATATLAGGQALELSLTGTATAASGGPAGSGDAGATAITGASVSSGIASGPSSPRTSRPGAGAVRVRSGRLVPAKDGIVKIATLTCPAGSTCGLRVPGRIRIRIAGVGYRIRVVAPRSLPGGASAGLKARLPKPALSALAGRTATAVVPVTVSNEGGARTEKVRAKLIGTAAGGPR